MFATCRNTACTAVITLLALGACKRDHGPDVKPITDPPAAAVSSKDSMYFIFKDEYLWTDVVPDSATFKPNSYSNVEDMFDALASFKKDANNKLMDKYSFLDKGTVAGEINGGQAGDYGFGIKYNNDINDLRVNYVYEASPAYQQGVRRGWQITAINGNTNLTYDGENGPTVNRILDAVYGSNNVNLTFKKPDGTTANVSLNVANYNINPVLYSTILNVGGRKVGYLVFNQFIAIDKAQPKIEPVFDNFISNNITDLVVDLRYNGGGAVETAEYLANLIAPVSVGSSTKVMYKEYFNANLTAHQYSQYFDKTKVPGENYSWGYVFDWEVNNSTYYFKKEKSLNLSNVVFIGTYGTASASELVMNVLKPYMNVKLVGDTTYGKPTAFIGIPVAGYDMYAISIWSKNAQGQGDYFNGFVPDDNATAIANNTQFEDYSKDWGSTQEVYLRRALVMAGIPESALGRLAPATEGLRKFKSTPVKDHQFKGMVETRYKSIK